MFLSCGDALYDLFTTAQNTGAAQSTAVILSGNVGGSPMNVAVGLARLGHQSSYFTRLSNDVFGLRMRRYLKMNEVQTNLCLDTDLNTTLAIVETNEDGSASYVFYTDNTADVTIAPADLPLQLSDDIRVLHFGSYSTAVEPTGSSLLKLAQREKGKRFISYDPNLRPTIEPDVDKWRDVFHGLAATATMIKASDEDIESLFGKGKEDVFLSACFDHGAKLVFITRGPDGSNGYTPDGKQVSTPGRKVKVVDTVGAGDTYQAAILHFLIVNGHISAQGELVGEVAVDEAINFAADAAAITCTRSGANLPRLAELG